MVERKRQKEIRKLKKRIRYWKKEEEKKMGSQM